MMPFSSPDLDANYSTGSHSFPQAILATYLKLPNVGPPAKRVLLENLEFSLSEAIEDLPPNRADSTDHQLAVVNFL